MRLLSRLHSDVTLVLDIDAAARSRECRTASTRSDEREPDEFYERVRQAYRDLAARESNRIVLIDGVA